MQEKKKFVRISWPVMVKYKTLEEPFTEVDARDQRRFKLYIN